jgi:hypothetical protein
MPLYDQLPVYIESYDLLLQEIAFCANIQRHLTRPLGERLINCSMDMLMMIIAANRNRDKSDYISRAIDSTSEIKILLRTLCDSKQISMKQYAIASEKIVSISKQLNAWNKYSQTALCP